MAVASPKFAPLRIVHAGGERESWTLEGLEDTFGSSLTAATATVLESELGSCRDLLSMEPDNKCACMVHVCEPQFGHFDWSQGWPC